MTSSVMEARGKERWIMSGWKGWLLVAILICLLVGIGVFGRQQQLAIHQLEVGVKQLEGRNETETTTWPLRVEVVGKVPLVFENEEAFAYYVIRSETQYQQLESAIERDIHNNPALTYWLAETHSAIDEENDPLPYISFSQLMANQKKEWEKEPYLTYPYDVEYSKGQD